MRDIGSIVEIWRYPVSSLGGERLSAIDLAESGIEGDRCYALVDVNTGQPAAPEKDIRWRPTLFLSSRLQGRVPDIGFPDGSWMSVDEPDLAERLGRHFGFAVAVRPYAKPGVEHHGATATNRYDPSPLHIVTTSAMQWLSTLLGTDDISSRRFRPNLVLDTSAVGGLPEREWLGRRLQLDTAILRGTEETKRCGLTLAAQPGLRENPDVLRSILRENRRNFGIYCAVDRPGSVSTGDDAFLIDFS